MIKLALVLAIVVFALDLKYNGHSSRTLFWEYSEKGAKSVYDFFKSLSGRDIKEMTKDIIPELQEKLGGTEEKEKKVSTPKKSSDLKK